MALTAHSLGDIGGKFRNELHVGHDFTDHRNVPSLSYVEVMVKQTGGDPYITI